MTSETTADEGMRALMRARRARLEARLGGELPDVEQLWLAEFELGGARWAFPLEALRAVLPLRLVTPVPLSPTAVVGLVRFEGEPLAVLSLGVLLGGHSWLRDPETLLVIEHAGQRVALDCEQVPRPVVAPRSSIAASRDGEGPWREVAHHAGSALRLIDLDRLLAGGDLAR